MAFYVVLHSQCLAQRRQNICFLIAPPFFLFVCDGVQKTSISNIYYINLVNKAKDESVAAIDREYNMNDYDSKYKKAEDTMVEYYFDNKDIIARVKQAGYRYLITTDGNLSPISMIDDVNRMHIIAIKHES